MQNRYYDFNAYLRSRFGARVQKITIDAGFSCPNRDGTLGTGGCIYCNAKGSGTGAFAEGRSITEQLNDGKLRLGRRYNAKRFIAYFQSFSNTYGPYAVLKAAYEEALGVDGVVGLSIGTRPDCVHSRILDLLATYNRDRMIWMEYGLQTAHEGTLRRIHRGHDFGCFKKAVEDTRSRGILVCAHVILGLPGEDRRDMMATADTLAALGVDGVKIHLLYVVKGSGMEPLYRRGDYACLRADEYTELVCDFLERLPPDMVIQRLTGDPHPQELLAPQWALSKTENLERIRDAMEKRDCWQGRALGYSREDIGRER